MASCNRSDCRGSTWASRVPTRKPVRSDSLRFRSPSNSLGSVPFAAFTESLARGAAPRDSRAQTPTSGAGTLPPTACCSSDRSRPHALGLVLAHLDRMAGGARSRATGHRRRVAPARVPPVLDLEEPTPPGSAKHTGRCPRLDPHHVADLFVVPTVTFRLLFVLVILEHDRRRLVHLAVTEHPTAAWTAQQLRNAFSENETPRGPGRCPSFPTGIHDQSMPTRLVGFMSSGFLSTCPL